jgi:uncharacterized protein (DUF736 family)
MIVIGTFSRTSDGAFHGAIRTLTLSVKGLEIRPVARANDKAPDHRILAGQTEVGAAWTVSRVGKPECLSVRIDDPGLPAPLDALLSQVQDRYELRWSRRSQA